MIFVAVGTQKFPMNRLLATVDELIECGRITQPVFAQTGNSDYQPKHFTSAPFLDQADFEAKIASCSLLITHGGVGTIIKGLSYGKPVIVCPRFARYGEHVDDHQVQIAESFSKRGYVLTCQDMQFLGDTVAQSQDYPFCKYVSQREQMLRTIGDYLRTLE